MQTTFKFLFAAGLLSAACVPAAFAAQSTNVFGQSTDEQVGPIEAVAREAWRSSISQIATPAEGCYQATYPSIVWEQTACKAITAHTHPLPRKAGWGEVQTTGNGNDYAIVTSTNITAATGSFPSVSGLTSEKGVGVPAFGDGGILGANEFTLQVNSNADSSTAACNGHSGCVVWQQFIYSPDYETQGEAAVFMQYWLIYYGSGRCPSGWGSDGEGDCYRNSSAVTAPDIALTSSSALSNLKMEGTATSGGNDTAVFTNGTHAYSVSGKDSVTDIATVWKQAEFNIVGNAGGSEAEFNKGTSVTVKLAVSDGSTATPTCESDDGTTGETNNLNLGSCSASGGSTPSIQFTESD